MRTEQDQKNASAVMAFLQKTKNGDYVEINQSIIEVPRNTTSRDEYVYTDKELSVYFSMSN